MNTSWLAKYLDVFFFMVLSFKFLFFFQNGNTALHNACLSNNAHIVEFLISKNADLNALNCVSTKKFLFRIAKFNVLLFILINRDCNHLCT